MLKKSKKPVKAPKKRPLVLAPPKSDDETMDNELEFDESYDNEPINPKKHKQFIEGLTNLSRTNHIKKSTVTESTDLIGSEFHLTKNALNPDEAYSVTKDILDHLKSTSSTYKVAKEISNNKRNRKVLKKKLENSVADKLHREVAYENTKKNLGRWDGIVAKNESAEHQMFPVQLESIYKDILKEPLEKSVKSDLMTEMEVIEAELHPREDKTEEDRNLTKDELIARRKEMLYLKIKYQQKVAKFRQQKKIKSKSFRRFEKKKRQILAQKEQELLEKTDPDAFARKIDAAERKRVLERASLKHKNTSGRTKNAKASQHNIEFQKELADQIALGRELTKHEKVVESESEEEVMDEEEAANYDPFNPWVTVVKRMDRKIEENSVGYKKYWTDRNEHEEALYKHTKSVAAEDEGDSDGEEVTNLEKLRFKKTSSRPDLDEELGVDNKTKKPSVPNEIKNAQIDPTDFAKISKTSNKIFDLRATEENEEAFGHGSDDDEGIQRKLIEAAFEDDDILADFEREQEDKNSKQNNELELSMPGWGSWVSTANINAPKRKRFILKFEKEVDNRKEENKGRLIVNDAPSKKLKQHLVSELPFPFTSVQEYEASIRAPIGRTFVTEHSFKALTRPAVITKKGKMINPMDEEQLLRPDDNCRRPTAVDKRLKAMK